MFIISRLIDIYIKAVTPIILKAAIQKLEKEVANIKKKEGIK